MPKDIEVSIQQQKRKRINRIKNGIILTIASWILISLTAIIVLVVQVTLLNSKYKKVNNEVTAIKELYVSSNEDDISKYPNIITGLDTEDNMYVDGDTRKVYLTFDCIPSENTLAILDALKENDIKATFFVTGDPSEEAKAIYSRIVNEGHTLAMHSYSNQYSEIYSSTEAFTEDMQKLQNYLEEVTGMKSIYYRFPGGSFNEISDLNMAEFVHILNENNVTYFDWNVTAGDASNDYTAEDIVDNVSSSVVNYKTSIVLLHDSSNKGKTAEAITSLVESLKMLNAEILPIDESTYQVQYIKSYSVE